ncbi:MAG: hypothetical protein PHT07_10395 [Paludibacter sp.]|nr:hypothetical protein [Paludibacter sp.]
MHEPMFLEYFQEFHHINGRTHTEVHNDCDIEVLEIRGQESDSELTSFKMLRVYIPNNHEVVIPNIIMMGRMRKKGFGMKMIEIIYNLSTEHGYRLFIDEMVPSFYNKMLRKGAVPINDEAVEIVENTQLFSNREIQ